MNEQVSGRTAALTAFIKARVGAEITFPPRDKALEMVPEIALRRAVLTSNLFLRPEVDDNEPRAAGDVQALVAAVCRTYGLPAPDVIVMAADLERRRTVPPLLQGRNVKRGVYVWLTEEEALYVGKAERLWNRITAHWWRPEVCKSFTTAWREECRVRGVDPAPVVLVWFVQDHAWREVELIDLLRPRFNIRLRSDFGARYASAEAARLAVEPDPEENWDDLQRAARGIVLPMDFLDLD